jgi:hypothetical protein
MKIYARIDLNLKSSNKFYIQSMNLKFIYELRQNCIFTNSGLLSKEIF